MNELRKVFASKIVLPVQTYTQVATHPNHPDAAPQSATPQADRSQIHTARSVQDAQS